MFRGAGTQRQRVVLRQEIRQRHGGCVVEIRPRRVTDSKHRVERFQNRALAGIQGFLSLPFFLEADDHLVRIRIGDVADLLNLAVAQALRGKAAADPVNGRRGGKADVHQRPALKVDPVFQTAVGTAFGHPGGSSQKQKKSRKGKEVFCLPHPVQIWLSEEFHSRFPAVLFFRLQIPPGHEPANFAPARGLCGAKCSVPPAGPSCPNATRRLPWKHKSR